MQAGINISAGRWPAWWTLGVEGKWPANGETDIMEYYRNKLLANIAFMGRMVNPDGIAISFPQTLWTVSIRRQGSHLANGLG